MIVEIRQKMYCNIPLSSALCLRLFTCVQWAVGWGAIKFKKNILLMMVCFFNVTIVFYQYHLQEIEQELSQSSKVPGSQMGVSVLVPGPNLLTAKWNKLNYEKIKITWLPFGMSWFQIQCCLSGRLVFDKPALHIHCSSVLK